jgi:rhomboid protease GluP
MSKTLPKIIAFLRSVPVSTCFLAVCIAVYLAMIATGAHFADPHNRALIAWGGNYRVATLDAQGWRLFTSLFVHGGLVHVLVNGISILDICAMLEKRIGAWRLLLVLFISGICAGLAALVWGPLSVVVGASGALMGAAGTLLVWFALPDDKQHRSSMFLHLLCLLVAALVFGALWSRMNNAAHIGGLLAGLVIGPVLWLSRHWRKPAQILTALALLAACLMLTSFTLRHQNTDEYRFRANLPEINRILQQNRQPQPALAQAALQSWQRCLNLAQGWQGMRLNPKQALLAQQLANLCHLQQEQAVWLQKARQQADNPLADSLPSPLLRRPQLLQLQNQINNLYQSILPTLGAELDIEYGIEAQIGALHGPIPARNGKK